MDCNSAALNGKAGVILDFLVVSKSHKKIKIKNF